MTIVTMVLLVNKALFTAFRVYSKAVANSPSYPPHRAVRTYLYLQQLPTIPRHVIERCAVLCHRKTGITWVPALTGRLTCVCTSHGYLE